MTQQIVACWLVEFVSKLGFDKFVSFSGIYCGCMCFREASLEWWLCFLYWIWFPQFFFLCMPTVVSSRLQIFSYSVEKNLLLHTWKSCTIFLIYLCNTLSCLASFNWARIFHLKRLLSCCLTKLLQHFFLFYLFIFSSRCFL